MLTGPEAIVGGIGLIGGAIATYVGLRLVPIEQHLAERKEARAREAEALDKRIQGLHDDAKEEREKFERRLAQIEQTYVGRIELERSMNAIAERMEKGLVRVEAGMKDLGHEVKQLAERVAKVEVS